MKTFIVFFTIGLWYNLCQAQSQVSIELNENGEKITKLTTFKMSRSGGISTKILIGTPYFYDEAYLGKFSLQGGKTIEAPLLFNLIEEEVYAQIGGKEITFHNNDFSLFNHSFVAIRGHYYEIIKDGNIKLLKIQRKRIVMTEKARWSGTMIYDGEIINDEGYFLQFPDKTLKEVNMTKKSIASVLAKQNYAADFLDSIPAKIDEPTLKEIIAKTSPIK